MKFISILILIILNANSFSQETLCYHADYRGATREKNIAPYDLNLSVYLKEKEGKVEGIAQYKFVNLRKEIDTIFFDAIQFKIQHIAVNGSAVKYRVDSAGITIYLPKERPDTNQLQIDYSCYPERGMYFLNWNNPDPKVNRQIWTQGQGIDNRHWIPGFDDVSNLLRMTVNIKFNSQYPVVSNGNLIKTTLNADKTKTWTYQMDYPHALYLTMIAAGDYAYKNQYSKGGVKLEQYYYPNHPEYFSPTYQHSEVMMDWFENEIKVPYAWGRIYRNVPTQDFLFGAMENTTSTIFADYMHQDSRGQLERGYLAVNAHELAHQWFGDLITERSAPHHWLHESFATHYSKKFQQFLKGDVEYDWIRKGERDASFAAGKNNSLPVAHSSSGSARHYPKGSFVLDMLRNELGNENYRKSIAYYLKKYYHKNVETCDLVSSIYESTGRNVQWFFDQWILRGGEPEIEVKQNIVGKKLQLITQQMHAQDATVTAFRMPMMASIYYKNGSQQTETVILRNLVDTFSIELKQNAQVVGVLLDESMVFLRKIKYEKPDQDVWIAENTNVSIARLEAIERMKNISWDTKKNTLLKAYHADSTALVKKEILEHIHAKISDDILKDILIHGLKDGHVQVRRQAIKSVYIKDDVIKNLLIERLNDSSYVNIELAVQKLAELYPEEKKIWLNSIKGIEGTMNNLTYLYHSMILSDNNFNTEHSTSLKAMKYLASESGEYRSRVPAINFLMEKNFMDIDIAKSMIQGAFYFHPGIRNASIELLKKIKKEKPELYTQAVNSYTFSTPNYTLENLERRIH